MISRRKLLQLATAGAIGTAAGGRAPAQSPTGASAAAAPKSPRLKIIALEEHYGLPAVTDAWGGLEPDVLDRRGSGGSSSRLEELGEKRLARMDAMGVDVQVLSLNTPGVQVFDAATAVALARASNDVGARAVAAHPTRFQCFATLPTPAPAAESVAELKRCVEELGFQGWLVNGRSINRNLDHPDFFPLFAAAAKLRVPVYLHPQRPSKAVRDAYYSAPETQESGNAGYSRFSGPGFGWHVETGIQAARLILCGLFDRLPELQIILGHWGETIMPYMHRLGGAPRTGPGALARTVPEYFRNNFHVTPSGMFEGGFAPQAIELMGVNRIMFSADDPFVPLANGSARQFIAQLPVSEADKAKIAHGNWERLMKRV